jgi:hypothetical protein
MKVQNLDIVPQRDKLYILGELVCPDSQLREIIFKTSTWD